MFVFLEQYYKNYNYEDGLGSLLGDLNPFLFKGDMPADPSVWNDWLECIKKNIPESNDYLTRDQAHYVALKFLILFNNDFGFELKNIINYLEDIKSSDLEWENATEKVLELKHLNKSNS